MSVCVCSLTNIFIGFNSYSEAKSKNTKIFHRIIYFRNLLVFDAYDIHKEEHSATGGLK